MDDRLQAYLDGELKRSALPPELQGEADRWDRLLGVTSQLGEERAPAWLEGRILAAISTGVPRRASGAARVWQWLVQPRAVTLRPIVAAGAGAVLLLAVILVPQWRHPATPVATTAATSAQPVVYVQFSLTAPRAQSVAVAGDFNGWKKGGVPLQDPDGDGIWTGVVPLRPGVHKYMFVVDGNRWETDPKANHYVDDGFGMRNALVSVTPPARRTS